MKCCRRRQSQIWNRPRICGKPQSIGLFLSFVLMFNYGAGAAVVDGAQFLGEAGGIAGAELDGLHRRSIVLGAESYDESLILQIARIAFQHGGGVPGGDELDRMESALLKRIRRLLQVPLEIREVPLGIICQERIGGDA